ncbi:MAG TPA: YfcE family phosphodiesterase [Phototrophicaceae bacterium]|jgi:putative phosphoesterase|nr:YfcE family phosphodiesterase [Phototrophicaceae bacterium]
MDIGIISDIHGDYRALEKTLDRLNNHHHVDQILCAGDLIGRGPEQDRVVQIIRESHIPTVRGNHDEWMYDLSGDNAVFLKSLPLDWRGEYEGCSLFMCHGKPGNNLWGLYRDHISDTLLNMMLASLRVDVLITGHTHVPLYVKVRQGCVVNPGSIYTFKSVRATSHTYGVLHLPQLTFDLYDITAQAVEPIPLSDSA